jgi:hypothetical protein
VLQSTPAQLKPDVILTGAAAGRWRAERLRKRLGGADWDSAFDGDPLPPMPPRMRWRTYRRLEAQYEELQNPLGGWRVGPPRYRGVTLAKCWVTQFNHNLMVARSSIEQTARAP